jgi:NAD(P)-dependent dehydrogenase (short-subunit alcohol dehydrogenase family)
MVEAFARSGAAVVVSSRKQELCEEVAAGIRASTGQRAVPIACHVGHWDQIEALVRRSYEEFGRVDVLVNNAGMSPLYSSLTEITEESLDKVLAVNLKSAFRLCALVGERMAAGDGGSIINVSAVGSVRPDEIALPYCAAKAGLDALTVGFARAYGPTVRVNSLMPGPFETEIAKGWTPAVRAGMERDTRLHRIAEADEIVGAALFLASDASGYMTGSVVRVDGGIAI